MPFDRLIRAVDGWARRTGRADLFAQIGESAYWPSCFRAVPSLTPEQFEERVRSATAVVSHAGTGTIITALRLGKPLLVLPRRAELGETRNDHQIATAAHFEQSGHVLLASDETQILDRLDQVERFRPSAHLDLDAAPELIERIRGFLRD